MAPGIFVGTGDQQAVPVKLHVRSTSRKVMLMLYGASLMVGIGLIVHAHANQRTAARERAMARLAGVTGTLSAQLDGGRVSKLLEQYDSRGMLVKNTQDAWYYVLHEALRKSAEVAALDAPLLILAYDPGKEELQIVATSDQRPALRDPFRGEAAGTAARYWNSATHGPLRTATANELIALDPVQDQAGRMVGMLLATQPVAPLEHAALYTLARQIGLAVLLFAALGLVLFRKVVRLVQHKEQQLSSLQEHHQDLAHSMAYAGKIQTSLVPPPERYAEQFADFFVLNRPRDVVSGDFHWYHRISADECLVAAADCTGHGLPGAMMATVACSLLNDLARELRFHEPAAMLTELNRRMIDTLHQNGRKHGAGDGMDIALCRIDRARNEILFAGAFRPLYWLHKGQLSIINGDRRPVGGAQHGYDRQFTVHRLAYRPGDKIYLFSDGYVDQFGGPGQRKFMPARLAELLLTLQDRPMQQQGEAIERAFLDWKGALPQVDDVCMLGLAV